MGGLKFDFDSTPVSRYVHGRMAFPWIVLLAAAFAEVVYRHPRFRRASALCRVARWTSRPWAAWAALNLVYRQTPSLHFNEPRTFPFYAHLWRPELGWGEMFAWLAAQRAVWVWGGISLILAILFPLAVAFLWRRKPIHSPARLTVALLVGCGLTALSHLAVGAVPTGLTAPDDQRPFPSLLLPWHRAGNTMLYAMRHVRGSTHFLRNFSDIHPHLKTYIHPYTHPPGATLALYWIGKQAGVPRGADIRTNAVKWRYALGLTVVASFGFLAAWLLGRLVGGSERAGWLSAALWTVAPMTLYNTFAMNGLFSVFFVLGLAGIWRVGTAEPTPWGTEIALGVCFFALNWLCFSWTILTTIFAAFLAWRWYEARWPWSEAFRRFVPPLAVMTLLSGAVIVRYGIRYLDIYRAAHAYACQWYQYANRPQALIAWLGGQMDLFLLAGAAALPIAVIHLLRPDTPRALRAYAACLLGIYALPILFGPGCLRMETARCWNWIGAATIAIAARELSQVEDGRGAAVLAVGLSALIRLSLRLFVDII